MNPTHLILAFLVSPVLCGSPKCSDYIEEIDVYCPTDRPGEAITYADPDHCNEYWECYNGCATHMLCPDELLYDETSTWCDTAQYVDCGDRPCENDECISNVATESPLDFECEADGYYPVEDDCAKFIVCEAGVATEKICPVGDDGVRWLYKEENAWCDFPENVDCGTRPVCDVDGNDCVTEAPSYCDGAVDCSDASDGYHEEEPCGECACYCSGGQAVGDPICCTDGTVWNPTLGVCDWPENVPACD